MCVRACGCVCVCERVCVCVCVGVCISTALEIHRCGCDDERRGRART